MENDDYLFNQELTILEYLTFFDSYMTILSLIGIAILAATYLPRFLSVIPISMPMVVLTLGLISSFFALGIDSDFLETKPKLLEKVTELAVIIALMEAGLKIDKVFGWKGWRITWRLLAITMPVTILLVWILGWQFTGLISASALLLGAVIAPTDPVLSNNLQVAGPNDGAVSEESGKEKNEAKKKEDEVRFSLTSESGLNDGLAFPFTYLALLVATPQLDLELVFSWVAVHIFYKIAIGVLFGFIAGKLAGRYLIHKSGYSENSKAISGMASLAITIMVYGLTELAAGYGFIAVFVGALSWRRFDPDHLQHSHYHRFIEQVLRIFTCCLIFGIGLSVGLGFLHDLSLIEILTAIIIVFLIRPISGLVAMIGSGLPKTEIGAISFLGLRGIGSLYYFYYAVNTQPIEGEKTILNITILTILLSIFIHGFVAH